MRCFGVQYRCIFLLILCILTRPAGSSKYCRTRKNVQRYCTPKHPIRYIYFIYICYLPAGKSVLEKYFVEVSKTARDRRSRDVFETETKYFSVRTDLNGK